MIRIIRLLCIESFVQNGVKKNNYDSIKRDILHVRPIINRGFWLPRSIFIKEFGKD